MGRDDIENNLKRNERIISKAQISLLPLVPYAIVALVLLSFGFFGFLIGALIIAVKTVDLLSTKLALTNRRVFGKTGVLIVKNMDSPLNKINSISVEKKLLGQIFGYARLVISTSSGQYNINYVKRANEFRGLVMEEIDRLEEYKLQQQAEKIAQANHMYSGYPNGAQAYGGPNRIEQGYAGPPYERDGYGGQPCEGQPFANRQGYAAQPTASAYNPDPRQGESGAYAQPYAREAYYRPSYADQPREGLLPGAQTEARQPSGEQSYGWAQGGNPPVHRRRRQSIE